MVMLLGGIMQCGRTFTGRHMFNPRRISKDGTGRAPFVTEYRCSCGFPAPDKKTVILQLMETRAERRRQLEESKRLTGAKRMTTQGVAELPGFGE